MKLKTIKTVTYDTNHNIISCLFCNICKHEEPGKIYYEDDNYCVFKNIKPVADCHLLIVSKKHFRNIDELEEYGNKSMITIQNNNNNNIDEYEHIKILKDFKKFGYIGFQNWLKEYNKENPNNIIFIDLNLNNEMDTIQYCFHIPPYNSVDHIHMHIIAGNTTNILRSVIYNDKYTFWCHSYQTVLNNFTNKITNNITNNIK